LGTKLKTRLQEEALVDATMSQGKDLTPSLKDAAETMKLKIVE
jgi:hypothetical protein